MPLLFGFLDFLGPSELLIVAVIAILIYGERLPEVAKTFGKQFAEFKKGAQSIRNEFESAMNDTTGKVQRTIECRDESEREQATVPKFEPPPAEEPTTPKFEPPPSEKTT